ncbi:MAG TPA: hypothetical protein VL651_06260 [Bacteroidia bacterium]|jgi:hypothetical protein|nr:hypothetical protein [Bacteroidia bacterium]
MKEKDLHYQKAFTLYEKGIEFSMIISTLEQAGAGEELRQEILLEIKNIHYSRRKNRGFKLVFAGALILIFGFILTVILFHSGSGINYAMYGLTTIGIILLLWGMIDILGW